MSAHRTVSLRDLTGERFGRLTVLGRADYQSKGVLGWVVRCDCGVEKTVSVYRLVHGETRSCGCLQRERCIETHAVHGHGRPQSPTYRSWRGMVARCTNPNDSHFYLYGGRGITVCERWRTFTHFLEDMGERPLGRTIDRIDGNGNYEPTNCRWSTASEQRRNRRPLTTSAQRNSA